MKRNTVKLISLSIALLVFFSMAVSAYADAKFSDTAGNWAETEIGKWVDSGIIDGYEDGSFRPGNSITRAEFSNIISKVFNYTDKTENQFSDVSSDKWYYDVVSKAAAAGIIEGDQGKFRPEDFISRQEAAIIIGRAFVLKVKDASAADKLDDSKDIAEWAKDAVSAVVENGYMTGRSAGIFAPRAEITRAETVKILDNILQDVKGTAGTYTGTYEKSLAVNVGDVTLKDAEIKGDLILAQGIGDGSVTLDNVKVEGRTLVLGGGENSIILNNTSLGGTLVIIKKDGKVRIVAKGSTSIPSVSLNSGAKLEEEEVTGDGFGDVEVIEIAAGQQIVLDGDFEEVTVEAAGAAIQVANGKVGKLEVAKEAAGANVEIASGATVTTLTANAAVQVTGKGKITTANVNAAGVVIEQKPTTVKVAEGITAKVAGTETTGTTGGTGEEPAPSNGGSSGDDDDDDEPGTEPETSIRSVQLTTKGGNPIGSSVSSSDYTVDLSTASGISENTYIDGLKIVSSPVTDKLVVKDVTGQDVKGTNGVFGFTGNNSIFEAFFGEGLDFDGDVSVKTIRSIFSGTITREIAVYSGSTLIKNITLSIKISEGDTVGTQELFDCYTISASGGTITATLKSGKEDVYITNSGFYKLLTDLITIPAGYSFDGVQIGKAGEDESDYTAFTNNKVTVVQNLVDKTGVGINELTTGTLTDKEIIVKAHASKPNNPNRVVTIKFE